MQEITALHHEYQQLTGFRISLMGREWAWFEWVKRGLGVLDLRQLVAEKRRRIRLGELPAQSLAFRNLVGNADYAEEDIAELRARRRGQAPADPNRDSVLRQTGRAATPVGAAPGAQGTARPTAAIIQKLTSDPAAAAKALAELRALKDRL